MCTGHIGRTAAPFQTGSPDHSWRHRMKHLTRRIAAGSLLLAALAAKAAVPLPAFNIEPGGKEARAVETGYRRVK